MNKEQASTQMKVLQSEMKKLQDIIDKPEKALHLESSGCDLDVYYGSDIVGYIGLLGKCFILNTGLMLEAYEQWRADGMPICSDVVEWRGGVYAITEDFILRRVNRQYGVIYDFDTCCAEGGCLDDNIKRHKHNNKPILF